MQTPQLRTHTDTHTERETDTQRHTHTQLHSGRASIMPSTLMASKSLSSHDTPLSPHCTPSPSDREISYAEMLVWPGHRRQVRHAAQQGYGVHFEKPDLSHGRAQWDRCSVVQHEFVWACTHPLGVQWFSMNSCGRALTPMSMPISTSDGVAIPGAYGKPNFW